MPPHAQPHNPDLLRLPDSRRMLEAFSASLISRWDELLRVRYQALHCFELEQIHDLRVASRRLRSAVTQLPALIGSEAVKRLNRPLKRLTSELGLLRNLDEACSYFGDYRQAALEPLLQQLQQQRSLEAQQALQLLRGFNCDKFEQRIHEAAAALVTPEHIASQGLLALLSERNLQLYQPIHTLQPLAALPEMVDERHALRIAVKKWRYFTELLHDILGHPSQAALLTQLRRYQTVLGDLNDREVFKQLLEEAELPEADQRRVRQQISREQAKLLKKFCTLLESQPFAYQFRLAAAPEVTSL